MISAVYPFLLTAHAFHSFRNCLLFSAVCCLMISAVYPSRSCLVFFAVYHFVLSAHAVHPCCPPKLSTLFCFLLFTLLDTVYSFLLSAHAAFSFLRLCCLPFQELSTLSAVHPCCLLFSTFCPCRGFLLLALQHCISTTSRNFFEAETIKRKSVTTIHCSPPK